MSDCNTVPRSLMAPGKQGPADIYNIEDPSGFDRPHPTHPATPACTCSLRNRRRRKCRRRRRRKGEGEGEGKEKGKGEGEEEGEEKGKGKGEGEGKFLKSNRS